MKKFGGGHLYSKIDLSDAYNQIQLSPASQEKLALSTHRGVLLQQRLPFGIASAPGYFQEIMDRLTQDLPGEATYMDDILVSGADAESHLSNLRGLLQRLDAKGRRCRKEKCVFAIESIGYLGYILSKEGISKGPKVDAVTNMPNPENVSELRAFLGQVQFYVKFLPNLSTVLEPLYRLTKKDIRWCQSTKEEAAFQRVKEMMESHATHLTVELELYFSIDTPMAVSGLLQMCRKRFHRLSENTARFIKRRSLSFLRSQSSIIFLTEGNSSWLPTTNLL